MAEDKSSDVESHDMTEQDQKKARKKGGLFGDPVVDIE